MNFALSDEQEYLREAARGMLSRFATLEAARRELDEPGSLPDLWPTAVEAGWPGLIVAEEEGGAGLGVFEAMLVAHELGRALASVPFIGLVPAAALLAGTEHAPRVAAGERRAVFVPAAPPDDLRGAWAAGDGRGPAPAVDGDGVLTGEARHVLDAPAADLFVVAATGPEGPRAVVVEGGAPGLEVAPVRGYDATRALAHVRFDGARGTVLDAGTDRLADAWWIVQALLASEALGSVEECLDMSVAYAKERHTFGRPIGSYQAIKHELVEMLRLLENGRALELYAGYAREQAPAEWPLAAAAARSAAEQALGFAARATINVHGGTGATWEHDAHLFFRRAQVNRRLLGGRDAASERVAAELLAQAAAA
jgi:alkylation response protein AidB-like acyl-CoA dehydrogenase